MIKNKRIILVLALVCTVLGILFSQNISAPLTTPHSAEEIKKDVQINKEIRIRSELPGENVAWKNKIFLEHTLDELDFWGNKSVIINGNPQTVRTLTIIITDKNTEGTVLTGYIPNASDPVILSSYNLGYDPARRHLTLTQYVNPDMTIPKSFGSTTRAKQYEWAMMSTLFQLTATPKFSKQSEESTARTKSYGETFANFAHSDSIFIVE